MPAYAVDSKEVSGNIILCNAILGPFHAHDSSRRPPSWSTRSPNLNHHTRPALVLTLAALSLGCPIRRQDPLPPTPALPATHTAVRPRPNPVHPPLSTQSANQHLPVTQAEALASARVLRVAAARLQNFPTTAKQHSDQAPTVLAGQARTLLPPTML